jgi:hypothetical protein
MWSSIRIERESLRPLKFVAEVLTLDCDVRQFSCCVNE